MIEGPRRLGREYARPEIQLPNESEATSRNRWGTPVSLRTGHTRRTRKKLTSVTANKGSVYAPNRPTTVASTRAKRRRIFTRPYATARYARYWLLLAARIEPSVIWKLVCDPVSTTVNKTSTTNCCSVRVTRRSFADNVRTVADNASPTIADRVPPIRSSSHMRAPAIPTAPEENR